jgi:hypothetical protein
MQGTDEADSCGSVGLGVAAPPGVRTVRRRASVVDTMPWGLARDPVSVRFIQAEFHP